MLVLTTKQMFEIIRVLSVENYVELFIIKFKQCSVCQCDYIFSYQYVIFVTDVFPVHFVVGFYYCPVNVNFLWSV